MVKLTVNGKATSYDGDPEMPLLWYVRDNLRLTGTRFGCGAGLCGACTVHAPHKPAPQPKRVPVSRRSSRTYQSSGLSGSPS